MTMKLSLRRRHVLLRNQALGVLEMASLVEDPVIRRNMLSFVVVGGGFARRGDRWGAK